MHAPAGWKWRLARTLALLWLLLGASCGALPSDQRTSSASEPQTATASTVAYPPPEATASTVAYPLPEATPSTAAYLLPEATPSTAAYPLPPVLPSDTPAPTATLPLLTATAEATASPEPSASPLPATPTALPPRATEPAQLGTILYLGPNGDTIRRVRPDGTGDEELLKVALPEHSELWFTVSPTGNELLYALFETVGPNAQTQWFLFRDGQSTALPLPRLYRPSWAPDGSRLLGGLWSDPPGQEQLYIFDFATLTPQILPLPREAIFCPDMTCLVFIQTRQLPPQENQQEERTSDLFRYDFATGQQTQLSYLDEAPLTLREGVTGTDGWLVRRPFFLPASNRIAFNGIPNHLLPGAGAGPSAWYSISVDGLPRGQAPELLARNNGRLLPNRAGTVLIASSGHHNNACSNPSSMQVYDPLQEHSLRPGRVPIPGLGKDEARITGIGWSPDEQQIVFAASVYRCLSAVDALELQPSRVFVWQVSLDRAIAAATLPYTVIDGSEPHWIGAGALAFAEPAS